jgi:hypothetical protein
MNSPQLKNEGWFYWLAFLIALGFRLIQLGATPLTDSEASLALQALHIAQGKVTLLGPQPAYILITSIFFLVTESTNFMARFLPTLAGSALVFAPWFFREKLKPRPALILAFLFAFDPGLVALSRQSSGTILAVTFLLFAWGMWRNGRVIPAGIFAGLALLSGPSAWSGLLMLILALIFLQAMGAKQNQSPGSSLQSTNNELRTALISLVVTLLLIGTRFFTTPNGLSAWLSSLPTYLNGWVMPATFTPGRVLLTFAAYEPLGILLAILALIRGFRLKSPRVIRLTIWLAVSLLLAVFYRQTSELVWVIIPLLILAAQELSRSFDIHPEERVEFGVVAGAIMILLVYIWFNVASIGLNPNEQIASTSVPLFGRVFELPFGARYTILLGASLILVVCLTLVAFGWSARTARVGVTWSFSLFLGIYTLAAAGGTSGMRMQSGVELWSPDQSPTHAKLLLSSLNDISLFSRGHIESEPVTIVGITSPALEWTLRNHEVEIVSTLDPQVAPPIVITPLMDDLSLPSAYRGQDFTWRQPPIWEAVGPPDWIKWLVYRQLPRETETIILWARDDLFPDAREEVQP